MDVDSPTNYIIGIFESLFVTYCMLYFVVLNERCLYYLHVDTRIYTHQRESFVLICFSCGVYLSFVCSGCAINLRDSKVTRLVYRVSWSIYIDKGVTSVTSVPDEIIYF